MIVLNIQYGEILKGAKIWHNFLKGDILSRAQYNKVYKNCQICLGHIFLNLQLFEQNFVILLKFSMIFQAVYEKIPLKS
jgi:hypothetical protein